MWNFRLILSEVMFLCTATANTLQTIPRPLLDRMEVIEISSYTENEKVTYCEEHLIPKQLEKHGLKKEQLTYQQKAAVKKMIQQLYQRSPGCVSWREESATLCRKAAREILEDKIEPVCRCDREESGKISG